MLHQLRVLLTPTDGTTATGAEALQLRDSDCPHQPHCRLSSSSLAITTFRFSATSNDSMLQRLIVAVLSLTKQASSTAGISPRQPHFNGDASSHATGVAWGHSDGSGSRQCCGTASMLTGAWKRKPASCEGISGSDAIADRQAHHIGASDSLGRRDPASVGKSTRSSLSTGQAGRDLLRLSRGGSLQGHLSPGALK